MRGQTIHIMCHNLKAPQQVGTFLDGLKFWPRRRHFPQCDVLFSHSVWRCFAGSGLNTNCRLRSVVHHRNDHTACHCSVVCGFCTVAAIFGPFLDALIEERKKKTRGLRLPQFVVSLEFKRMIVTRCGSRVSTTWAWESWSSSDPRIGRRSSAESDIFFWAWCCKGLLLCRSPPCRQFHSTSQTPLTPSAIVSLLKATK